MNPSLSGRSVWLSQLCGTAPAAPTVNRDGIFFPSCRATWSAAIFVTRTSV